MVGVGAGLANGGLIPFVCGAAPFLTGRALEQIKADLAYSNANVKLCGISPRHGLRRARPDAPLDRGLGLAAGHRQPDGDRARRPDRDRRRPSSGRRAIAGPMFIRMSAASACRTPAEDHKFELGRRQSAARRRRRHADRQRHARPRGMVEGRGDPRRRAAWRRGCSTWPRCARWTTRRCVAAAAETGAIVTAEEHTRPRRPGRRCRGGRRGRAARCRCASSACPASSRRPARPSSCSTSSAWPPAGVADAAQALIARKAANA